MKKFFSLLFALITIVFSAHAARIMVLTDPHVLDTSLIANTQSMEQMLNSNRKMLDMSEAAMTALIDSALQLQPDVVLIPGDLTKDGELVSHQKVASLLSRLTTAGIPAYVIPGNHDVGNPSAYSYKTDPATKVATIDYAQFRTLYANYGYTGAVAYDEGSMSYVADIVPGVTLLAIDASNNNAGDGAISDATLAFLMAQTDSAEARGNVVIAMQHWQLLEHVDNQSMFMSSATLTNREQVRDSLMAHGVGLIFTGHFHISGITTYHAEDGGQMVEVTTGSPITFPCPYRLLDVTKNDSVLSVDIETRYIASLDTITDMWSFSHDWMDQHIRVIIPTLSNKVFSKMQSAVQAAGWGSLIPIPSDDSTRVALFNRYMADPSVACYLIHSATNEWQDPRSAGMEEAIQDSIARMVVAMQGSFQPGDALYGLAVAGVKKTLFSDNAAVAAALHEPLNSMLQDVTGPEADCTDDLTLHLLLRAPQQPDQPAGVEVQIVSEDGSVYDLLGRPVPAADVLHHGICIQGGKKILK